MPISATDKKKVIRVITFEYLILAAAICITMFSFQSPADLTTVSVTQNSFESALPSFYLVTDDNSFVHINEQKDSLFYRFLFYNSNDMPADNFRVKVDFVLINSKIHATADGSVSSGVYHVPGKKKIAIEGAVKINKQVATDTAYFYLRGNYSDQNKTSVQVLDYVVEACAGFKHIIICSAKERLHALHMMRIKG